MMNTLACLRALHLIGRIPRRAGSVVHRTGPVIATAGRAIAGVPGHVSQLNILLIFILWTNGVISCP